MEAGMILDHEANAWGLDGLFLPNRPSQTKTCLLLPNIQKGKYEVNNRLLPVHHQTEAKILVDPTVSCILT